MRNNWKVIIQVLMTVGIFAYFMFIGIKGLLGFFGGVALMSYAILSGNPTFLWFVERFGKMKYYDKVRKI